MSDPIEAGPCDCCVCGCCEQPAGHRRGHLAATDCIRALREANEYRGNLLREWCRTPFFETEDEWCGWADEFRGRVKLALKGGDLDDVNAPEEARRA